MRKLKKIANSTFKETKMNKKLVVGLALALVLVSGSMFGARADCGCLPHFTLPSCFSCGAAAAEPVRDRDCAGNLITPYDISGVVSGG